MSDSVDGTRDRSPDDVQRSAPASVFAAGETVPNLSSWLLERKLGGGGFGEVWLARHAWNAKEMPRAVKFCTDPAARHRLVTHERNVVLRVMKYAGDHPNVVPLLDCNLDGDIPWLMYEFVEGGTLAGAIKEWHDLPMPRRLGRAVRTLHAVAGALARFHRFDPPLVHRDMKPHNVMMAGAVPRITDFGIGGVVVQPAGAATGALTAYAARLPSALHSAGTRIYAPPEQMLGGTPNPRDDVYALGIIAYQMVMADLMTTPGADAALELRDLKVPGELVTLIVTSVAMNPDRRPKDAGEWEAALSAVIGKAQKQPERPVTTAAKWELVSPPPPTEGPTTHTELAPQPLPPPPAVARPVTERPGRDQRKLWLAGSASLGAVLLVGLAVWGALHFGRGRQSESSTPTGASVPKPGDTREVEIADGASMTFCWVPAGECQLGSPKAEYDAAFGVPAGPGMGGPPGGGGVPGGPGAGGSPPGSPPGPGGPPAPGAGPGTGAPPGGPGSAPTPGGPVGPGGPPGTGPGGAPGGVPFGGGFPGGPPPVGVPGPSGSVLIKLQLEDEAEGHRGKFRTSGFWMGKYEVTQAEWGAAMRRTALATPGRFRVGGPAADNLGTITNTSRFPAEGVSWDDCNQFLILANTHGGIKRAFGKSGEFALPHEDAWEYACRGGLGNRQPFSFGKELNGTQANADGSTPFGTTAKGPYLKRPAPVGSYAAKFPHPWGLCDMHGNVWEWCDNTSTKSDLRAIRGGCWNDDADRCRSACRGWAAPASGGGNCGFRVVIRLD